MLGEQAYDEDGMPRAGYGAEAGGDQQ